MKIKICGITQLEDARFAAGARADFLGFVQYQESPRFVDPHLAAEILSWVYGPQPVGVFVDASADAVNRAAEEAGFVYAQLHGDESPDMCADVAVPVIKALRIFADTTPDELRQTMDRYVEYVSLFLLDTGHVSVRGGSGRSFDWSVAAELAASYDFLLAGGLSAENVEGAIARVAPFGVDVSSSLESAPGRKDPAKLDRFFAAVRRATAQSEAGR